MVASHQVLLRFRFCRPGILMTRKRFNSLQSRALCAEGGLCHCDGKVELACDPVLAICSKLPTVRELERRTGCSDLLPAGNVHHQ
ncbi:hypothetical protein [Calycomorphotria hydatis]|uniref:hypothetical protein n=1 Tax=Calycomorphotria hydatis TaxID=2528027 RepID=UPI0018D1F72E|nr:hypothetical protein [Calycomorphotria hydatis]